MLPQVLIDWEIQCPSQRTGLVIVGVLKEGTATMLTIEFAGVDGEGKKRKKSKMRMHAKGKWRLHFKYKKQHPRLLHGIQER